MTGIHILFAIIVTTSGSDRPVSMTAEFNSLEACQKAADNIRAKAKGRVDLLTCEKKS